MTKRISFFLLCISFHPLAAYSQEEGADTTSRGYQIGYEIGSWLPFIIIFTLAVMVIVRSYRLSRNKDLPSNND